MKERGVKCNLIFEVRAAIGGEENHKEPLKYFSPVQTEFNSGDAGERSNCEWCFFFFTLVVNSLEGGYLSLTQPNVGMCVFMPLGVECLMYEWPMSSPPCVNYK